MNQIKKIFLYFTLLCGIIFPQVPEFSFLQLTDLHLSDDSTTTYTFANSRTINLIKDINNEKNFPIPQFVLITGDIANAVPYSIDKVRKDMEYAKKVLDSLQINYFPLIGNHESAWSEGDTARDNLFTRIWGVKPSYTYTYRDYVFVFLNNSNGTDHSTLYSQKRNFWLDSVLYSNRGKNIILCAHISLRPQRKNIPDWAWISDGHQLDSIINKYAANIVCVLSGHVHLNSYINHDGINYICTSALASFPNEYKRFNVFRDSIEVETFGATPLNENIWNGYSDPLHPDAEIYASGTDSERKFSMKFKYNNTSDVELTILEANKDLKKIVLKWGTIFELNKLGFEIQRQTSYNNWEDIGFISGTDTNAKERQYSFTDNNIPEASVILYRLKILDFDGNFEFSNSVQISFEIGKFDLLQNYPNPFNPSTIIKFNLSHRAHVSLVIYDILGRLVKILVDEELNAGDYTKEFIPINIASGMYLYRLQTSDGSINKKMIFFK